MSKSDELKETIASIYGSADWKRISKRKLDNAYELREFQEPKSGTVIQAYTHLESQKDILYNGSKIIFGIAQDQSDLIVRFGEPFYQRAGIAVESLQNIFGYINKEIPAYLRDTDDDDEWQCDAGLHNRDQLVADLVTAGFTFDLAMSNDLNEDYGGPVYGKPTVAKLIAQRAAATPHDVEYPDYEAAWMKAPKIIFGVWDSGKPTSGDANFTEYGLAVSFALPDAFERDDCIESIHVEEVLKRRGFQLPAYLSEDMENTMSVWEDGMDLQHAYPLTFTKAQVIKDLEAIGFTFSKELDDMLNNVDEDEDNGPLSRIEQEIAAGSKVLFGVFDEKEGGNMTDGIVVMFTTPEYWAREHHMPDSHLEFVLEQKGFVIPKYLSESAENFFRALDPGQSGLEGGLPYPTSIAKAKIIKDLEAAGFVWDKGIDAHLNRV